MSGAFGEAIRALAITEREPTIDRERLAGLGDPAVPVVAPDGRGRAHGLQPDARRQLAGGALRAVPRPRERCRGVGEAHDEQPLRAGVHLQGRRAALLLPRLRRAPDRRQLPDRRDQGPGRPRRRAEGPPRSALVRGRNASRGSRMGLREGPAEAVRCLYRTGPRWPAALHRCRAVRAEDEADRAYRRSLVGG